MKKKTGSKSTYWEKLKDPRWQKKRLEVLSINDFSCAFCSDKESMLHVHHLVYKKGAEPWEYSNDELRCLCESCHKEIHYETDVFNSYLNALKLDINLMPGGMMVAAGFIAAYMIDGPVDLEMVDDEGFRYGVGKFYKKTEEEVAEATKDGKLPFEVIYLWVTGKSYK